MAAAAKIQALIVDDETHGLDRVKEVQPLFYGDHVVILQNGARLNMSRNFRSRLEKLLRRGAGG